MDHVEDDRSLSFGEHGVCTNAQQGVHHLHESTSCLTKTKQTLCIALYL